MHGVWHDRSLFSTRAEFESQQELLREAAAAFGAVGFRSPATYRVPGWLAELPFEYDCTMPLSDPYEPQPGGCCSPWPYFIGDTVELPWTLTQDHTLFTVLRQRDIDPWLGQADRLRDAGGLIQLLPHPDPGYLGEREHARLYEAFLDRMAEHTELWNALPRDVARWWRHRDRSAAWSPADYGTAMLTACSSLALRLRRARGCGLHRDGTHLAAARRHHPRTDTQIVLVRNGPRKSAVGDRLPAIRPGELVDRSSCTSARSSHRMARPSCRRSSSASLSTTGLRALG